MTNSIRLKQATRFIGRIEGREKGPTVVFFGGIHGNEPAGTLALTHVIHELEGFSDQIKGNVFAVQGNIPARLKNQRFLKEDLNRLWTIERIEEINAKTSIEHNAEEKQLLEIHEQITKILATSSVPFYFIDLHTTSSRTLPFITINDALINRKFSEHFPVPVVLGLEEYLDGPLLSYINEKGYVSLGFESGMHTDETSVANSISFIWLTLIFVGILNEKGRFELHYSRLKDAAQRKEEFYEITYRHQIGKNEKFKMMEGFDSFEKVEKGTLLARHDDKEIRAERDRILFMPLYQNLGADGFFLIRKIPPWALRISTIFRTLKMDRILVRLPGISWKDTNKNTLLVDLKIAKFLTTPFFHLLGYRNRTIDKNHVVMNSRERVAKTEMYNKEWWYNTSDRNR